MPAGDANDDNNINLADFGVFVRHFGTTAAEQAAWPQAIAADFNGDEAVSIDDFFLLAQNFGEVGMKLDPLPVAAARPAGRIALEEGMVRLQEEGEIVGFSLLVLGKDEIDFTTEGTIWAERQTLILYGSLENLQRDGQCWAVQSVGGFAEIAGYLDATTGELIFAWLIPEG